MMYRCRRCGKIVNAHEEPDMCPACGRIFYDVITPYGFETYGIMEEINSPDDPMPAQDPLANLMCDQAEIMAKAFLGD